VKNKSELQHATRPAASRRAGVFLPKMQTFCGLGGTFGQALCSTKVTYSPQAARCRL
jgi:hypothetical protein